MDAPKSNGWPSRALRECHSWNRLADLRAVIEAVYSSYDSAPDICTGKAQSDQGPGFDA
jgi:hypothetical protein